MTTMRKLVIFAFCAALLGTFVGVAAEVSKPTKFTVALASVPTAELPAKAAALVKEANANEREAATVTIVKAAVGLNPAAAPAIVGAIARSVPDMAAVAAATAANQQPKQATAIARAAAAAAPANAGKIVTAVCRVVPNEYRNVAVAVSQVVPGAEKDILKAVAEGVPDLKASIEKSLSAYAGSAPPVTVILDSPQVTKAPDLLSYPSGPRAPLARGPAIGPPYIPLSATPTNVNPGNSGEVPPGGRDYASP